MASVKTFLERGGTIKIIPTGQGKKEAAIRQPRGDGLRRRMTQEVMGNHQTSLLARPEEVNK